VQDKETLLVGRKLRATRQAQGLSIQQVSEKAQISVATLSRIETNKQGVDLGLFLLLARILHCRPGDLLDSGDGVASEELGERIALLDIVDRIRLWRKLATDAKVKRSRSRSAAIRQLALHVDELLAQIDFVRAEIEWVTRRLKKS
jgi:transcriptional regulator with XRE-family HTH domain